MSFHTPLKARLPRARLYHGVRTPEPLITFADLKFATPSGRIEIASERAVADGHPRVPLPLADPRPTGSQLCLLSPASSWRCNSSFGNVAKMKTRERNAEVMLHPADATDRHLQDGDDALVANETGRLEMRVHVSDAVPRGVALTHKGRWPKHEPYGTNVNLLNPGRKQTWVRARACTESRSSSLRCAAMLRG